MVEEGGSLVNCILVPLVSLSPSLPLGLCLRFVSVSPSKMHSLLLQFVILLCAAAARIRLYSHTHFHSRVFISLFIQLFLITMALPASASSSSSAPPGTFLTCCEFLFVSYCSFLILSSASASQMNIWCLLLCSSLAPSLFAFTSSPPLFLFCIASRRPEPELSLVMLWQRVELHCLIVALLYSF